MAKEEKQLACGRCNAHIQYESVQVDVQKGPLVCLGLRVKCAACGEQYYAAIAPQEIRLISGSSIRVWVKTVKP